MKTLTMLLNAFHRFDEIRLANTFVSTRLITEELEKKFRLHILVSTPNRLTCEIIRPFRPYNEASLPRETLELILTREGNETILRWRFRWPQCYAIILVTVAMSSGIVCAIIFNRNTSISHDMLYLLIIPFFIGLMTYLDTRIVATRIKGILKGLLG